MTKISSFPPKSIDTWNGMKEVIMAKNVQQIKEKLDKYRYGDRDHSNVAQVLYNTTS